MLARFVNVYFVNISVTIYFLCEKHIYALTLRWRVYSQFQRDRGSSQ